MKKLLTLTLFLAAYYGSIAQTCIEYKETGIIIRTDIIGRESNIIRYTVTCPSSHIEIAQDLLNISMFTKDGVSFYGSNVSVPNLPSIYDAYKIETIDVGKSLKLAEQTFGANLIKGYGLLNLDNNWTVKNK